MTLTFASFGTFHVVLLSEQSVKLGQDPLFGFIESEIFEDCCKDPLKLGSPCQNRTDVSR
mgnify:CR=1 FL=1